MSKDKPGGVCLGAYIPTMLRQWGLCDLWQAANLSFCHVNQWCAAGTVGCLSSVRGRPRHGLYGEGIKRRGRLRPRSPLAVSVFEWPVVFMPRDAKWS